MIIYKSKKKARTVILYGVLLGALGGILLFYTTKAVVGWSFIIAAIFVFIYGIGTMLDRKPQLILDEKGITEMSTIRERIEWDAILRVDDFFWRGQDFVRLLLPKDYKSGTIQSSWFWRFDRIYAKEGVRAFYIRVNGLEINSATLVSLIEKRLGVRSRE